MVKISVRVPVELPEAVDGWAVALGTSRSSVIRGVLEDMVDAGEPPVVPPTRQEELDEDLERLRELCR